MAKTKLSRRKFMLAVGAGGAAGVAAVAAKTLPREVEAPQPEKAERKGYELSEHVRKYYRTTLV
ncbi:MAG TPA: twin-arginine translocation signal domain-containing protein [Burkholderiales bacterium]|nr:twin-arginine translocation signal domain-containing protein [Burkholderiales bacterium]